MTIFYLDKNPCVAAKYACDKHVVKMILETAQILCSCINDPFRLGFIYRRTHYNHPCVIWARRNRSNFLWLVVYGICLAKEYEKRYGKIHKSLNSILAASRQYNQFPVGLFSAPPLAMPDEYKNEDHVLAYRNYYIGEKHFATWKTEKPYWYRRK